MKQTQKRSLACGFALGFLLFSFAFWTAVLAHRDLERYEFQRAPSVWNGLLTSAGYVVQEIAQTVDNTVHFAASVVEEVSEDLSEVTEEPAFNVPFSRTANEETDLEKWEMHEEYALSIPALGIQAPVFLPSLKYWKLRAWELLEKQMQVGLAEGAVVYPHSVEPGARGTLFLAGHSSPPNGFAAQNEYGHLFKNLPDLKPGDDIFLRAGGKTFTYTVRSTEVVSPSATEILLQQDTETLLKILTCFPIGTTKDRMVVTAAFTGSS
ncbi:hypothetical protein COU76_04290 [Candidatus Peregrinibacteria bacterium CG10_big_fil_rev_8_21_14_0_10_49_10]|nr:MAG: hypothetical protein COU76_04290 [Candidatus Peregrinibacteria bacterium CG10_big_fil_rev_8_21_14_0_10_49_10]